jgi:hypothetical protein
MQTYEKTMGQNRKKYRISIYFPSPKDTVSIYFQMCIASIATVSWSLGEIVGTFQGLPAFCCPLMPITWVVAPYFRWFISN